MDEEDGEKEEKDVKETERRAKTETVECPCCGNEIPLSEHDVNWGMCRECMNRELEKYLKECGEGCDGAQ